MRQYCYRETTAPYRESAVMEEEETMENVIAIRKTTDGFGTISRVMACVAKQDFSAITRADIDDALTSVAKTLAQEQGISFEDAYAATLTGESGAALYAAREEIPVTGVGAAVAKQDSMVSKSAQMERDVERYATTGVDLATARKHVSAYYRQ